MFGQTDEHLTNPLVTADRGEFRPGIENGPGNR
jgi:hypothetical protein